MGLSLKFRCPPVSTGGQPLIREQGHPNQVLSVETRPTCSLQPPYIFTALSQSCPQTPPAQASPGDSPSTAGAGALCSAGSGRRVKAHPGRSPAPTASSLPSPGSAGGGRAQWLWAATMAAPARSWPQLTAPAASSSPCPALPPGSKCPERSSYEAWIQLIMDPPGESISRACRFALVNPLQQWFSFPGTFSPHPEQCQL